MNNELVLIIVNFCQKWNESARKVNEDYCIVADFMPNSVRIYEVSEDQSIAHFGTTVEGPREFLYAIRDYIGDRPKLQHHWSMAVVYDLAYS